MEGGPPGFRQGFTCPAVLRCPSNGARSDFVYGAFTRFGRPSQKRSTIRRSHRREVLQPLSLWSCNPMPTTVQACHTGMVWAVPRSLAATEGISVDVCSSGYLDGSVPPVSPHDPLTGRDVEHLTTLRVTPFGHPRISGCLLLLAAFRSLPRPSSPSSSKASTVDPCPLAISPIYPSLCPTTTVKTPSISGDIGGAPALGALAHPCQRYVVPKDAQAYYRSGVRHRLGFERCRGHYQWCATWRYGDSNPRPMACKAIALAT